MSSSVKFQKNRNKNVGGVAHTRYRGTEGQTDGMTENPLLFFEKAGDNKRLYSNTSHKFLPLNIFILRSLQFLKDK